MTAAVETPPSPLSNASASVEVTRAESGVSHFHLRHASWGLFTQILAENAEQRMRLTYADGGLCFMSPLPMHESWKELIDTLVKDLCTELGIPRRSMGSTTWLRPDVKRGIESDECYYLASEPLVRGKTEFDLTRDPPPDLAIEIDLTHSPIDRPAIYAALGVPELWVYDGRVMRFLKLVNGQYESATHSVSFPFVTPADTERHLALLGTTDETTIVRAWRQWVRERNA